MNYELSYFSVHHSPDKTCKLSCSSCGRNVVIFSTFFKMLHFCSDSFRYLICIRHNFRACILLPFKNPLGFLSVRIRPFYCLRRLTEQSPHALVPRFRERKHILSLSAGIFSRTKAKITYELSCRRKSCKILDFHGCFHICSYFPSGFDIVVGAITTQP